MEQGRRQFDAEVERFSVLETGQQAAMDAPVILDVEDSPRSVRLQFELLGKVGFVMVTHAPNPMTIRFPMVIAM